jgi:hypothetical protein
MLGCTDGPRVYELCVYVERMGGIVVQENAVRKTAIVATRVFRQHQRIAYSTRRFESASHGCASAAAFLVISGSGYAHVSTHHSLRHL